jgi:hypothetical protein
VLSRGFDAAPRRAEATAHVPAGPAAEMTTTDLSEQHFEKVVRYIAEGELVPLLGAGVNVCDRTPDDVYELDRNLPSGVELSELLASEYGYPTERADRRDLLRVAQYAQARLRHSDEEHRLRDSLHRIFRASYGPTSVHRFLAGVPQRTGTHLLALTTNYDDALEQAFDAAGEPYSVIFYRASREGRCWLRHGEEADARVIARPERYTGISLHDRSVILKVHGAVDRQERRSFNDSYVISEDHYIDFLASTRLETLVPKALLVPLLNSALLFLGYRLKDWNLRVILHELWSNRDFEYPAWAVHREVDEVDAAIWRSRNVTLFDEELCAYIEEVSARLGDGIAAR